MFRRKTKPIASVYESIAVLEQIKIGGLQQTILIRGENVNNPIMLFLHGGPGTAQIGFAPKFQKQLEKNFMVVNWDQRGAGLSFLPEIKKADLSIETMVGDVLEVIDYLVKRFRHTKLFLVGHSWGTILGVKVSKQIPQRLYAYIAIGQVVNMKEGEKISYDFTIEKAKELKSEKAQRELMKAEFNPEDMKYLGTQRKWLVKLGGSYRGVKMYDLLFSNILFASEYTIKDWLKYLKAVRFSIESLWPSILETNFFESVPALDVPVYFMSGTSDFQTPFSLVEKYFVSLECPHKEMIWFDNSAHLPNFEESGKFYEECLRIKQRTLPRVNEYRA